MKWAALGILAVPILAGCVGGRDNGAPPTAATQVGVAALSTARRPFVARNLYVADAAANSIIVYAGHSHRILRTITEGLMNPGGQTFDSAGNLYVENSCTNCHVSSFVTVYPRGSSSLALTISAGIDGPAGMIFDESGNLYVANSRNNTVTVYAPGQTEPFRTISSGLKWPTRLAFDRSGNLYVVNLLGASVTMYAPGGTEPIRTITDGMTEPGSLAFDNRGRLFVSNCSPYALGTVTVYSARQYKLIATITEGLTCAGPVSFSEAGDLYVGDFVGNHIQVYRQGGGWHLLRTISDKIDRPHSDIFDRVGNLYVSNCLRDCVPGQTYVTRYAPGGGTVRETFSRGLILASTLAFGP
jgi:DNA-binding beta-propeller fold protein YncE